MKKNIFIILLMSFSVIFTSCGIDAQDVIIDETNVISRENGLNNQKSSMVSNGTIYEITKVSYIEKDVLINYPQITISNDNDKQKKINQIIEDEALKVINEYNVEDNEFSLEIFYEVKWKSENLLSIQYSGYGSVKGGPYPNNIFYTTNIDIDKGIKLKIKDLLNIDESFIEKFKAEKYYKPYDSELNVESEAEYELSKYTIIEWIEYFKKADDIGGENQANIFSYLTKDSLGISIGVAHAIGGHIEFEIKYEQITNNFKIENKIQKDFF